ncbi:MAG: hypothetical protein ACT4NP_09985 [Pseudonocardiales bacterium]
MTVRGGAPLASAEEAPHLLVGYRDPREAMTAVVDGARRVSPSPDLALATPPT